MTKNIILFILAVCLICSCNKSKIPIEITSKLSDRHFRMKNTQLFVVAPEGYEYKEGINLFVHPDSTVIHYLTAPINFYVSLKNKKFDFLFNKSFDVLDQQEFRINELPGIYFELLEDQKHYHYFYFGDSLVENLILGVVPKGSNQFPDVLQFVTTSYYDETAIVDPLESAKFQIYPSLIGFQFQTNMMNQFVYFEEGHEKYAAQGEGFNSISISQWPGISSVQNINTAIETLVSQMENQGLKITDILFNDTLTVDGNYAKAMAFEATYENVTRIVYVLTAGKNNTLVNVAGNFHHNGIELVPKIHALASEMRITDEDNKLD